MSSKSATNATLLGLLDRHLKNKPHERAEITINGANHEITSSALDLLVEDAASGLLAARLILTLRDVSRPHGGAEAQDQPATEVAAHVMTSTSTSTSPDQPPSSSSTLVIIEETPQAQDGSPPPAPQRASAVPTHHPLTSAGTGTTTRRPTLAETYSEYIKTFMADAPGALAPATGLPRFLHQPVRHNTRAFNPDEYHSLGRAARHAIPDIKCEVVGLAADEGRQIVAARLEFAGTMVRPFAGVPAPVPQPEEGEGHGRPVRIGEIVFYWFDGGRIREVVSMVDLGGLGGGS